HYYFEETGLALGHRRLSIVDLSPAGRQPMRCPQGRYILSFNGEIYNYRELRSELENLGHTFRTETDTEVLLAGYTQWQVALFPRLAGMFALALVDTFHRQLLLVRDPTGVKPLVYSHGPGYFGFASEVKAFLDWPTLKLQFSDEAQATFLEFGYLYDSTARLAGTRILAWCGSYPGRATRSMVAIPTAGTGLLPAKLGRTGIGIASNSGKSGTQPVAGRCTRGAAPFRWSGFQPAGSLCHASCQAASSHAMHGFCRCTAG
ncbi:MAG TPA: hypothetical protein PKA06_16555, partial [Gemmatales bacterium]|nr:hypothetical protein [Gemmatales bacterium]